MLSCCLKSTNEMTLSFAIGAQSSASQSMSSERLQAENFSLNKLTHAFGGPVGNGVLRASPEDFFVEESLSFPLSGEGEHLFLFIEKREANTDEVARLLAKLAAVKAGSVSFAGLKDRHAITRQWFSVALPGKPDPDFSHLPANIRILRSSRHSKKLRRGTLKSNRFELVIRDFQGDAALLNERLEQIKEHGFPNYYGEQRFGREYGNLSCAIPILARGRTRRKAEGIYLSAVRSMLFNTVLSQRIEEQCWNSNPRAGDVMQLAGSSSLFNAAPGDMDIAKRLATSEISITGPLAGRDNRIMPLDEAKQYETQILSPYSFWTDGLEKCGLDADRRALRAEAMELEWIFNDRLLKLEFSLSKGSYATALTREIIT